MEITTLVACICNIQESFAIISMKKRAKNSILSSQPLVEEIEDGGNVKTHDDIEIDAMPKLIGMFDPQQVQPLDGSMSMVP